VRGYRKCAEPGCETHFKPRTSRNRFCLRHRKTGPVDPSHYRKYGPGHRALRARFERVVAAGEAVCARCGDPIAPTDLWDLGHVDGTFEYAGPEHARCNRATSTHRAERRRWFDETSRIW
jgi:hypothetical protein